MNNGGISVWYNELTDDILHGDKVKGTTLGVEIASSARFAIEDLEYETLIYFYVGDVDPFEDTAINPLRNNTHLKELGFYLLPSKELGIEQ